MSNVHSFPVAQMVDDDDIDFSKYMRETDAGAKVRPAHEYLDRVMHLLAPATEEQSPVRLPFRGSDMVFRMGEVTVYAGFNGSGKSALQGQVMGHLANVGQKVCIASFEMKPDRTLERMARQFTETRNPQKQSVSDLLRKWEGRLWLYDQQGSVVPEKVLAVIRYCAQELGIQHIAVDSLMKCVKGEDDYNGQKDFVNALTVAARDNNVHIHLVHHMRKSDTEKRPTRMDMRGSAAISDHVDNVLLVWRNEAKEKLRDAGQPVNEHDADTMLICDKHRNGDWQGVQKLWYRRDLYLFTDSL